MHQFVHIGDPHFGPNSRNADRRRVFDAIVTEGLALPSLAAWWLPGDINHGRMAIDDRNYLRDRVQRMAARAPVVIVRGNHDLPGDLEIFAHVRATWPVTVVEDIPQVISLRTATGAKASIFCLPYPSAVGLVGAGVAPGEVTQRARDALSAIVESAAQELQVARERGDLLAMLGHINVGGSVMASGQPNIGQEVEVDPTLLARLGPDVYKGLNHVHVGQEIGGAWYPGSICRLDYGEIHPKRWLLVEYAGRGTSYTVRPMPIDVAPLYHVEAHLDRHGLTWQATAGPEGAVQAAPETWDGCEIRVRVRFAASERHLLDEGKVHVAALFGAARKVECEWIAMPDRALRAPAVAAARTLADKVGAWADLTGTVATEAVLAKLAALEHDDPERVMEHAAATLAALLRQEKGSVAA